MIINSLYEYYQRLAADPQQDVPEYGYSSAGVSFAFNISPDGELLNVIDLRQSRNKKLVPVDAKVPEQIKRAVNIAPNFMCDNSTYIIGVDQKNKPERVAIAFQACKELHKGILESLEDAGAKSVCAFFDKWQPEQAKEHSVLERYIEDITGGANIVFMFDGRAGFIHETLEVRTAWADYKSKTASDIVSQCLVTGKESPITRLHPSIRGVPGGQSTGVSMVSFNKTAFEFFGKSQGSNSPVSEEAAFGYTTALNHLLKQSRQRLKLNDSTVMVFWSEASSREENLMAELLYPTQDKEKTDSTRAHDPETVEMVRDTLRNVRNGKPIKLDSLDAKARFYILGLSSNAARLSVRFWQVDSFGVFVERIARHHADMAIERSSSFPEAEFIPITWILQETAPRRDKERIPPLMGGVLLRSILTGSPYPQGLYTAILTRIRSDQTVNYVRAAIIRGCLIRQYRQVAATNPAKKNQEVTISMSLDESNTNTGYRLGRLFAVLEKAQQDAQGYDINSTIRDKYFGSASATPAAIFPLLIRLSQHHIAKSDFGYIQDRRIQSVLNGVQDFPQYLNLEDQGRFMLGYYHQKQAFYKKGEEKE